MRLKSIVLAGVMLFAGTGMIRQQEELFAANDAPYLFDIIKRPAYKKAWLAMFRNERGVPQWLVRVEGPSTPMEQATMNGVAYQKGFVCKPHDCGDNSFHVIFSADGTKAWGLLLVNEVQERFFGSPGTDMMALLRQSSHQ